MDQAEPPVRQSHAPPRALGLIVRPQLVARVHVCQLGSDFEGGRPDHRVRGSDHGLPGTERGRIQHETAAGDCGRQQWP